MKGWALAALALALLVAPAGAGEMRACDGRWRHVTCHWAGGDRSSDFDVPPDEHLGYGPPTVTFTDHGRIRIVAGACEIVCEAAPPAATPAAGKSR